MFFLICWWLDSNLSPLMLEAIVPQQLPITSFVSFGNASCWFFKYEFFELTQISRHSIHDRVCRGKHQRKRAGKQTSFVKNTFCGKAIVCRTQLVWMGLKDSFTQVWILQWTVAAFIRCAHFISGLGVFQKPLQRFLGTLQVWNADEQPLQIYNRVFCLLGKLKTMNSKEIISLRSE